MLGGQEGSKAALKLRRGHTWTTRRARTDQPLSSIHMPRPWGPYASTDMLLNVNERASQRETTSGRPEQSVGRRLQPRCPSLGQPGPLEQSEPCGSSGSVRAPETLQPRLCSPGDKGPSGRRRLGDTGPRGRAEPDQGPCLLVPLLCLLFKCLKDMALTELW